MSDEDYKKEVVDRINNPDDPSDEPCVLYIVFKTGGYIACGPTSTKYASAQIRNWYNCREHALNDGPQQKAAAAWLENGTVAINWISKNDPHGASLAQSAFAVSEVIGMYFVPQMRARQ